MPKYVIERDVPGAGALSAVQLREISLRSIGALGELGPRIQWIHSYVTDNKIYCVYLAPDEPCTPTSSACGVAPAIEQTVQLVTDCPSSGDGEEGEGDHDGPPDPAPVTKKELCAPDPANQKYCLWMPL